jgi:HK97 gp10 family phage protein
MDQSGVFGKEELIAKFRQLSETMQGEALVNVVKAGGMVVVNAAKENIKKQGLIRTRNLSRSVHQEVAESTNERAAVDVGTDVEYAALHEFGGTVQAKTSKYLAIPVGNYRGSPRKHGDLKLRKTAGGNLVMIDEAGIVQYVLKKSVEIQAKPYLRPAADEHHGEIEQAMEKAFVAQIKKVTG